MELHSSSATVTGLNQIPQPKPEKLSFDDLKKDLQVNVFLQEDDLSSSTGLTALRIEPMIPLVNPNPIIPDLSPVEETVTTLPEASGANKLPKPSKSVSNL